MRKALVSLLLALMLVMTQAQAATYRDTSDIPMVQMMLIMMDLMGMLNRAPDYGYGGLPAAYPLYSAAYPFNGGMSPLGAGLMNPYTGSWPPTSRIDSFGNSLSGWQNYQDIQNFQQFPQLASTQNPVAGTGTPSDQTLAPENWGMGMNSLSNPWEPLPTATRSNFGLNGIWQGEGGDFVAIYGNRFMWSGNNYRSLSGQIKIDGEYLFMAAPAAEVYQVFRIQQNANGGFSAMDSSGRVMRFRRLY
jgi:hypothetical protein